jgi:hypothetical protein
MLNRSREREAWEDKPEIVKDFDNAAFGIFVFMMIVVFSGGFTCGMWWESLWEAWR